MHRWLPESISTYGGDIDSVIRLVYYLTLLAFILMEGALLYMIFFSKKKNGERGDYFTGDSLKQAAWTLIPFLFVIVTDIFIDIKSTSTWKMVITGAEEADISVRIEAEQFNWQMVYPGPDKLNGTEDDRTIENVLHVPVDRKIRLTLTSRDVIHSFFVPVLRLKMDCLPGREIDVWFEATKVGEYESPCAELCGLGHSGMLGRLIVHSSEDYQLWLNETWDLQSDSVLSNTSLKSTGVTSL